MLQSHQHLVTTPGNKQKQEALPFATRCVPHVRFQPQGLVTVCSTCFGLATPRSFRPPDRDTYSSIVFTVLKIHCPWTARKLICTIITNKRKQMVWVDRILKLLIIKRQVAIIFHGSHCNTHFPIFSNKKLLKKIRNENCSIRVDEPFSTRLLSKCRGPVVPPVATPRNSVHLFESVLNRTI